MLLFCLFVSKLLAQNSRFYAKTTPFVPRPLYFVLCTCLCSLSFVLCPLSLFFATNIKSLSPCLSQIPVVAATKREEKRNKIMTRQKTAITLQCRKEQKTFLRQEREKKKSLKTN